MEGWRRGIARLGGQDGVGVDGEPPVSCARSTRKPSRATRKYPVTRMRWLRSHSTRPARSPRSASSTRSRPRSGRSRVRGPCRSGVPCLGA